MKRAIQTLLLFAVWLLFSGHFDAFHVGVGLLASIIVSSLFPLFDEHGATGAGTLLARLAVWIPFVLWRVALANIHTGWLVFNRHALEPKVFEHKTWLRSESARVLFATSITLTPGTITCDLAGDTLLIHQLDGESAGDVDCGLLEDWAGWVFGEAKKA